MHKHDSQCRIKILRRFIELYLHLTNSLYSAHVTWGTNSLGVRNQITTTPPALVRHSTSCILDKTLTQTTYY